MLVEAVCQELVMFRWINVSTTGISNLLGGVNVAKVVIVDRPLVDI